MSDLTFRDARPDDIATILALSAAGRAGGPVPPEDARDPAFAAALAEIDADPNTRLVVAERKGDVVGCLQITVIPGLPRRGMKRGLLENVHVRADLRGGGIGTRMVRWAIGECRARGCGLVQLTSNKVRHDAHRFYKALGFVDSHEGFKLEL